MEDKAMKKKIYLAPQVSNAELDMESLICGSLGDSTTPIITTDEDPEESPGGMNGDARRWNDWDDFENEEF
jgi:hypothetical protein